MTARPLPPVLPRDGPGGCYPSVAGATLAEFLMADNPYHRWLMAIEACREIHASKEGLA